MRQHNVLQVFNTLVILFLFLNGCSDIKKHSYSIRSSDHIKFAVVQLDTQPCEIDSNIKKSLSWAKKAFDNGADYVFFHEGLTADYTPEPLKYAIPLNSPKLLPFVKLANEYKGHIVLGVNEAKDNKAYLSMVFLGPKGIEGVYRKSYLWPNDNQLEIMGYKNFSEFMKVYKPGEYGYRCERATLAGGDGTKVLQIGTLRIGTLICADGSQEKSWDTFKNEKPDVIFWQNNRDTAIRDGDVQKYSKELGVPILASNRCGYSWKYFQLGGSCICSDAGKITAQANEKGEEEIIYSSLEELRTTTALSKP
jgi:predicted amidohydrolase